MSLKEEKSYWLCCDGGDARGKCHSAVGPSKDLRLLAQRAGEAGWQLLPSDHAATYPVRCTRHKIEVKA